MAKTPLRAIRIADDLWQPAKDRAIVNGETVTAAIRRALTEYIADPKK